MPEEKERMSDKQTFGITIPTSVLYSDEKSKAFWQAVQIAIARGEEVSAKIKAVSANIDATTLTPKGPDAQGLPLYGVGADTKLSISLGMDIDLSAPTVSAAPPATAPVDITITIPKPESGQASDL
jgi:hypothetical protein